MKAKTLLLTAGMIVPTVAAFGQAYLTLGNSFIGPGNFIQPIFGPNPTNPFVQQTGNPSGIANTLPAGGTTVYGGPLLQSGYELSLYAGPTSAIEISQMSLITSVPFRTATANKLPAGLILSQTVQFGTGNLGGEQENFIIAAFSTEGGTVSTYDQALANFNSDDFKAQIGTSSIFTLTLGGIDSATGDVDLDPNTTGWTSFSLVGTPEPSTIALAGLGAAGLVLLRRRKL